MKKIVKKTKSIKTKKTNKAKTYIALVIDRSGSMTGLEKNVVDGVNEQINVIKQNATKGGDTYLSYLQFDNVIDVVYDKIPAKNLEKITTEQYKPRGTTALRDAVWKAIQNLKNNSTNTKNTAYLVIVVTDGYENASVNIDTETLAKEIKTLEETGNWTFTYMLSNVKWEDISGVFTSVQGNTTSFTSTPIGTAAAYITMNSALKNYLDNRACGATVSTKYYSNK